MECGFTYIVFSKIIISNALVLMKKELHNSK